MKNTWIAFAAGMIMGWGLCVSQMINPSKAIAFLDIFGRWDPSLALVMAGALLVTMISFRRVLKRKAPLWAEAFALPVKKNPDAPLITGAIIFGIGWGLSGLCPAPAIAGLACGLPKSFLFAGAMAAGMFLQRVTQVRSTSS